MQDSDTQQAGKEEDPAPPPPPPPLRLVKEGKIIKPDPLPPKVEKK